MTLKVDLVVMEQICGSSIGILLGAMYLLGLVAIILISFHQTKYVWKHVLDRIWNFNKIGGKAAEDETKIEIMIENHETIFS